MTSKIIFVGSYDGNIHTLHFDTEKKTLQEVSKVSDSRPGPSWQMCDPINGELWSNNEGDAEKGTGGSVDCYKVTQTGELIIKHKNPAVAGAVSLAAAPDAKLSTIFLASYFQSSIQSFSNEDGKLTEKQTIKLKLKPGHSDQANINSERQDTAHPHQVVIGFTGKFLFSPDLGNDLIHVFSIDAKGGIEEKQPIKVSSGAGPRHIIFDHSGKFLYCIEELANTVQVYEVFHNGSEVRAKELQRISTLRDSSNPQYLKDDKPKPAEGYVTNDNKHFYVSNRYDASIDGEDTLVHYTINDDGTLKFEELSAGGGTNIWHFTFDKKEEHVAVATQDTGKVTIYDRNTQSGKIGGKVAQADVQDAITANWWF